MAQQSTPGGHTYDPATGGPTDEGTSLNRDSVIAGLRAVGQTATATAGQALTTANQAKSSADRTAQGQAQAITNASLALTKAAEASASAASSAASAGSSASSADSARRTAERFGQDVEGLKVNAGWNAGSPNDAQNAAFLRDPNSESNTELKAQTVQSIESAVAINVYDYGAVDSATTASQSALDAAMLAAEAVAATGAAVKIAIPRGTVRGNFTVRRDRIHFTGPGTLVGEILYKRDVYEYMYHFKSKIIGLEFRAATQYQGNAIRVMAGADIEVTACRFNELNVGVDFDAWSDRPGQQNATINVHHNYFFDCNYAVKGEARTGNSWHAHCDSWFSHNVVRHAGISAVRFEAADGFTVDGNIIFNVGYSSTAHPFHATKGDSIYFGQRTNFLQITNNKIFESGACGIRLNTPQMATVTGNQIAWPGQRSQSSGIAVNVDATYAPPKMTIADNQIDGATLHGIQFYGNGSAERITVANSNEITLYGTDPRETYYGTAALNANIYRVHVNMTNTAPPRMDLTHETGTRQGLIYSQGLISHSRRQVTQDKVEMDFWTSAKTFTAGTGQPIAYVASPSGATSYYTGEVDITVEYTGGTPPALATYKLLLDRNDYTVKVVSSVGRTTGAQNWHPSFTFSINTSNGLVATPVGGVNGPFKFHIASRGMVQVGMIESDAVALT